MARAPLGLPGPPPPTWQPTSGGPALAPPGIRSSGLAADVASISSPGSLSAGGRLARHTDLGQPCGDAVWQPPASEASLIGQGSARLGARSSSPRPAFRWPCPGRRRGPPPLSKAARVSDAPTGR